MRVIEAINPHIAKLLSSVIHMVKANSKVAVDTKIMAFFKKLSLKTPKKLAAF